MLDFWSYCSLSRFFSWKPVKVYEALHLITVRDIKGAAELLLECVSTFTCTELCSYNDFILYTVVTNVLSLPRTTLKKKIVDGPEVRTCPCLVPSSVPPPPGDLQAPLFLECGLRVLEVAINAFNCKW